MDCTDKALKLFMSGYGCAQAVFAAFEEYTKIDMKTSIKLTSGLSGGMSAMREVCGACTAMIMVYGILYGKEEPMDNDEKNAYYKDVREMVAKFKAKNGSVVCRELLAGLKDANENFPHERTAEYYKIRPCARFVADAAQALEETIKKRRLNEAEIQY